MRRGFQVRHKFHLEHLHFTGNCALRMLLGAIATQNYGFVAFKSEAERDSVVGKRFMIHGKHAKITHDTRDHKRTTGVMDEIWVRET